MIQRTEGKVVVGKNEIVVGQDGKVTELNVFNNRKGVSVKMSREGDGFVISLSHGKDTLKLRTVCDTPVDFEEIVNV